MPRSSRRQRRDRGPDYQRHRPRRQDNTRETGDHQVNVGALNRRKPLNLSCESELREYTTEQGAILELANLQRYPNPELPPTRFCAARPRGGFWGVSDEEMDILYHFRWMKTRGPGRDIIYQLSYRDDEAVSKAKQDGCPVRITSNDGRRPRDGVDRGLALGMVEHSVSPPEEHAIRMGRSTLPVVQQPDLRPPRVSGSSRQDALPLQLPLRQVKEEETE
ncbi:hypothetical protein J7337_009267 [Fusarium musae]|uniref:Uncharacterized protein n=1 Tax=Fusarium musae TaxID=1042133 RepID=A0A9P8DB06_9HYPO|nr:hypothetical protein J7337_009267 [Fusarium musae]KAG9498462.1 hypothetical protein J7337_009267 [Fusarium musae]